MVRMSGVLAIIPAREGSKGLPGKNMALLGGKSLIARAVESAVGASRVDKVLCTTDGDSLQQEAIAAGAEAPFLRPAALSGDDIPMLPVLVHAIRYVEASGFDVDVVVLLQVTTPLRTAHHVDEALDLFLRAECDSLVSLTPVRESPHWMRIVRNGKVEHLLDRGEANYEQRQSLPEIFKLNGAIYIAKRNLVMEQETLTGGDVLHYVMPQECSVDIDSEMDMLQAKWLLEQSACQ